MVEPVPHVERAVSARKSNVGWRCSSRAESAPVNPAAPNTETLGDTDPPAEPVERSHDALPPAGHLLVGQGPVRRAIGKGQRQRDVALPQPFSVPVDIEHLDASQQRLARLRTAARTWAALPRRAPPRPGPRGPRESWSDPGIAASAVRAASRSNSNAATVALRSHSWATSGWISPSQPAGSPATRIAPRARVKERLLGRLDLPIDAQRSSRPASTPLAAKKSAGRGSGSRQVGRRIRPVSNAATWCGSRGSSPWPAGRYTAPPRTGAGPRRRASDCAGRPRAANRATSSAAGTGPRTSGSPARPPPGRPNATVAPARRQQSSSRRSRAGPER